MAENAAHEIRQFIRENILFDPGFELGEEVSLIQSGLLDSTGVLELISWLESTYDVTFDDRALVADNFDSIGAIVRCLTERKAAAA